MRRILNCIFLVVALGTLAAVWGQQPAAKPVDEKLKPLASNAPKDAPKGVQDEEGLKRYEEAIAPYVAKARATLPDAKKRFQKGLKKGEVFFVTVRIYDAAKRFEQVFVEVKSWKDDAIKGLLASDPDLVKDTRRGDKMMVREKEIYDWTITKPDGTEDGNFVGKFLDNYHP